MAKQKCDRCKNVGFVAAKTVDGSYAFMACYCRKGDKVAKKRPGWHQLMKGSADITGDGVFVGKAQR